MEFFTIPVSTEAGRFILYRPLAGLAMVGNRSMAALAAGLLGSNPVTTPQTQGEAADYLRTIGFLDPDPPAPEPPLKPFEPTLAVLLLTNQCQLRCTYCYALAGVEKRKELSFELGKAAIRHVCANAQRKDAPFFEVSFHGGGEPVLAWQVLRDCASFARAQPLPAKLTLTTNGIWTEEQGTWIIEHLDGLTLSLDGRPETQNRQRPLASGSGSFARAMRTVAQLDRHKFQYSIRLTATPPFESLPDEVRFLCHETGCPTFQVEPAFNLERGGHGQPEEEQGRSFARAFLQAVDAAVEAGRYLFFSGARLGMVMEAFCSAPYQGLIVNADGDLVTCYEIASRDHRLADLSTIGRISDGIVQIDQQRRSRLLNQLAERRAACQDCFCSWSCAGNCYARAFGAGEDGHLARGVRCEINRQITEGLLLRGIEAAGKTPPGDGVWRSPHKMNAVCQVTVPRGNLAR